MEKEVQKGQKGAQGRREKEALLGRKVQLGKQVFRVVRDQEDLRDLLENQAL